MSESDFSLREHYSLRSYWGKELDPNFEHDPYWEDPCEDCPHVRFNHSQEGCENSDCRCRTSRTRIPKRKRDE